MTTASFFLFREWRGEGGHVWRSFFIPRNSTHPYPACQGLKITCENESNNKQTYCWLKKIQTDRFEKGTVDKLLRVCAKSAWMCQSFITSNERSDNIHSCQVSPIPEETSQFSYFLLVSGQKMKSPWFSDFSFFNFIWF